MWNEAKQQRLNELRQREQAGTLTEEEREALEKLQREQENGQELALTEIEQRYPDQWVLVEETAWDEEGYPTRGVVRVRSPERKDLIASRKEIHKRSHVKTFIFYTGEKIPEDLMVVL